MKKSQLGGPDRHVQMDLSEELWDRLRSRGILFIDGEEVDATESGCFYRDMFYLAMSGWPKEKPIWVIDNSPGGHADQCFAICDTINAFKKEGYTVNTLCLGAVASAATIIFQAGSRRYAMPTTRFLIHQVRQSHVFLEEELGQGKDRLKEMERINNVACKIIADRVGMDLSVLLDMINKTDLWLSPEDALKFGPNGLIDEICETFPFMDRLVSG